MQAIAFKIYEIFKSKLRESEAQTICEYFDAKASSKIEERKDIFLTKDDKLE